MRCWVIGCLMVAMGAGMAQPPLPRPELHIPELPPLPPMVITPGGQRLPLAATDVTVRWDAARGLPVVSRPGCWAINYPLDRIAGLDPVAVFGRPAAELRNWYFHTPGTSPEPPHPNGPAPLALHPTPTLVVDQHNPAADDAGPGTAARPFRTLAAALKHLAPGSVVRVRPGVYREGLKVTLSGTAAQPIVIEGERGPAGELPVISGNDAFPAHAWRRTAWPGVWRADLFTKMEGTVSADGATLLERSLPSELAPGEFCLNRGSTALAAADRVASPTKAWSRAATEAEGFLELTAHNALTWASTWVWLAPHSQPGVVWRPEFPQPITGEVKCGGEFRALRMTGAALESQVNPYRAWVNGARLPACVHSTQWTPELHLPRPERNYGFDDRWQAFPLREGWNQVVIAFDTTVRPDKTRFRLGLPAGVKSAVSSAGEPADKTAAGSGQPQPFVSEWLLSESTPAVPDRGVYVRLPDDADPNGVTMDLAARTTFIELVGDYVQLRGFEIRHGAQFQQRGQVNVSGAGCLVEGCLVRDSEVKGIALDYVKDQRAPVTTLRDCWVVNPGNTGIGGTGSSDQLTPENENTTANGRSRVLIELCHVSNANWTGTDPFWESGGMKLFRLTGAVVRYNEIVGGSGPCLWLDWEHFNNRLEGNLFRDGWAFGIGIEASPGPNLVANNLSVNLRPGEVWFRYGLLSWSSDRYLALHNTIDGRWNNLPAWQNLNGADGIYLNEGGDDRGTRWGNLAGRKQVILNNLVLGCDEAMRSRPADEVGSNVTDRGRGATAASIDLVDPLAEDYRLRPASPLNRAGVTNDWTKLVTHDFDGLLRLPEDGCAVGALRATTVWPAATQGVVEAEFADGTMRRWVK